MLLTQQACRISAFAKSTSIAQTKMLSFAPLAAEGTAPGLTTAQKDKQRINKQSSFITGTAIYTSKIGTDEVNRLAKEAVIIGPHSKNNFIDLASGNILLNPEKNIIVSTKAGNIHIGARAIVFITECDDNVVIYDLLQTKPKQVSVMIDAHKLIMHPGLMLALSRQDTNDFEKFESNCHSIAYSHAKLLNLYSHDDPRKAFIANFSISSALIVIQPLKRLMASNNKQDNIISAKLIKSSVIISDFNTGITP